MLDGPHSMKAWSAQPNYGADWWFDGAESMLAVVEDVRHRVAGMSLTGLFLECQPDFTAIVDEMAVDER